MERGRLEIYVSIHGAAATGKTYYLQKIAEMLEEAGFNTQFGYEDSLEVLRAIRREAEG